LAIKIRDKSFDMCQQSDFMGRLMRSLEILFVNLSNLFHSNTIISEELEKKGEKV